MSAIEYTMSLVHALDIIFYGYMIESSNDDLIYGCGGFIGSDYFVKQLKEEHPELFDEDGNVKDGIEVAGDAEDVLR